MSREYRTAEHIARELIGMLIEDGADAVALTWSRTNRQRTEVRHESLGNTYAIEGMLREVIERYVQEDAVEEEGEEEQRG